MRCRVRQSPLTLLCPNCTGLRIVPRAGHMPSTSVQHDGAHTQTQHRVCACPLTVDKDKVNVWQEIARFGPEVGNSPRMLMALVTALADESTRKRLATKPSLSGI